MPCKSFGTQVIEFGVTLEFNYWHTDAWKHKRRTIRQTDHVYNRITSNLHRKAAIDRLRFFCLVSIFDIVSDVFNARYYPLMSSFFCENDSMTRSNSLFCRSRKKRKIWISFLHFFLLSVLPGFDYGSSN